MTDDGTASRNTAPEPEQTRSLLDEDWLATIVGLVLVLLVLAGVIVKGMIP